MSTRRSGCGCLPIIGIIGALAIAGGYAVKKGWHQLLIGQKLTPISGAKVIPDEAILTGFISTETNHWQQLENLGLDETTTIIQQATTEIDRELTELNLDYEEDIQSWLGNAMLAIVPETPNLDRQNTLVVLGIKNPINAYKFLKKVKTAEKDNLESVEYQGIKINIVTDRQGDKTNLALLGNKIVISDEVTAIEQAIDTYRGEPSFASVTENQIALKQPLKLKNNLVNIYLTDYNNLLTNSWGQSSSQAKLARLQPVESIVLGIGVEEKQLKLKSFTELNPNLIVAESKPITNKIANKFPEETIAFISGQGISDFWSSMVTISEQDRDFNSLIDGVRNSTRWVTGLDLDRDVFSWMDGEFAFGIVPTKQPVIPELNLRLGTVFLLESSDRNTATNTLNALNKILQQQLGIISQTKQLQKQTVNQLLVPYSNTGITYGWLDNKNLLFTVGNDVFESIDNSTQTSLAKSSDFQELARELPRKNQSYFYFNVDKALTQIKQIPGLPIDYNSETLMVLESIQSVGAASKMIDNNTSQTDMVVLFK